MSTLEIYFLVLVCGALGAFALSRPMGAIRHKSCVRAERRKNHEPHH